MYMPAYSNMQGMRCLKSLRIKSLPETHARTQGIYGLAVQLWLNQFTVYDDLFTHARMFTIVKSMYIQMVCINTQGILSQSLIC